MHKLKIEKNENKIEICRYSGQGLDFYIATFTERSGQYHFTMGQATVKNNA
jgi:hypothetical protein